MIEEKNLINARDFFTSENEDFKKEMEVETLLVDIACEFIKYREKNGLTQKDLAEKLQITQAMVSKLESGDYNPTVKLLFEIAKKLSWNFKIEFNKEADNVKYKYDGKKEITQNNISVNALSGFERTINFPMGNVIELNKLKEEIK